MPNYRRGAVYSRVNRKAAAVRYGRDLRAVAPLGLSNARPPNEKNLFANDSFRPFL
jgi:hypothetical protein